MALTENDMKKNWPIIYTQYRNDRFMKYLLKYYPEIRVRLCRCLLDDDTIEEVTLQNVERGTKRAGGKSLTNDFVGRTDDNRVVNIEMQASGISSDDYDRFRCYGMFLLTENYHSGRDYEEAKEVAQIIINIGGGLKTLKNYEQRLEVMDKEYKYIVREDKLRTTIYNTKYLKEERDMSQPLNEKDQFMYLLENDKLHPHSNPTEMMHMIKEAHDLYLGSTEQRLGYYADLLDEIFEKKKERRIAEKERRIALKEGKEEGLKEGTLHSLALLMSTKYNVDLTKELEVCSYKELQHIFQLYLNNESLETILDYLERDN